MASVTLDQMRDTLITLDDLEAALSVTEPLHSTLLVPESAVRYTLTDGWNEGIDDVDDHEAVSVTMSINGDEAPMTKSAILIAAAKVGLTGAYVKKTPAKLIEDHLNYWYSGVLKDQHSVLRVGDNIAAFARPSHVPFSNLDLLESAVSGIRAHYGESTEILADYKFSNTLAQTDMRLIVPESQRTITGTAMADVPSGESDLWSAGVHVSNSLIGKSATSVESYLFRWWCTNGATTTSSEAGQWIRKARGQEDDVYVWARESVDEVLGGMESRFAEVQALTDLNVAGNTADVIQQIFSDYSVPVSQREQVGQSLLEAESLTMYTIMNAITQTANTASPTRADRMMRIGGSIPTATFDTVKAKVWAEGHQAEPDKTNPYAITAQG